MSINPITMATQDRFITDLLLVLTSCDRSAAFVEHIEQGVHSVVYFDTLEEADLYEEGLRSNSFSRPISGFFVYTTEGVSWTREVSYGMTVVRTSIGCIKMFHN